MTSVRNVVVHIQLFCYSSKIYYSNIVKLGLYVVYYTFAGFFDTNITEKNHVLLKGMDYGIDGS